MHGEFGGCVLKLVQGDIVRQPVDAIVNAANSRLAGGGGVDGAIQDAAGPALMEETDARYPEGCPTGSAVITAAGELQCRHVIHAVGPVWRGGVRGEPDLLRSAYRKSLELAIKANCASVAFPAISTGAYGYPTDLAAEHSLGAVSDFLLKEGRPAEVRFVLFDAGAYGAFARVLEGMLA
ncbi:MAG: macro domain-containing protein [Planctomycetaceae bacterium]